MKLKRGVLLALSPSMARALPFMEDVIERETGSEMVITCAAGLDHAHKPGSRHYTGEAVDVRTRDWDVETGIRVRRALKATLGRMFDVVLEEDHIHVEFDPKGA